MLGIQDISARVTRICDHFVERDQRMDKVAMVRDGQMSGVYPEFFSGESDQPMVANFIDVVARDLSEAIAPLPALNCASGVITNDRARRFAARRQRIGANYWGASNLAIQMFGAADNYVVNGFTVAQVEPCYKTQTPKIRFMDSKGSYPVADADGNVVVFVRKWETKAVDLAAQYPEYSEMLTGRAWDYSPEKALQVVRYVDQQQTVVYVPSRKNLVLETVPHKLKGKCPVVVIQRPTGTKGKVSGQFDDVLGVQAARALMMRLAVEAAEKQVQAPLAVPDDVVEVAIGPDAMLRSQSPEKIGRVSLGIGDSTFRESATLSQELMTGARFPEGRIGNSNASVITGRGVEALMGGYDSQVKAAQTMFAHGLRKLTSLCFAMDEAYWPGKTKSIQGTVEGTPFEETYLPSKDIKGDHTCEVTYGFLAGMDPNRALVFLLQLRGDRLIDRQTVQKQMPFEVDVTALQQNIDVEELRDALKQGALAYVQAIGPMAQAGQDPTSILRVLAAAVKGRQSGKPLEELLLGEFQQIADEAAQKQQEMLAQMQGGGTEGLGPEGGPPGVDAAGLLNGVAPGQAGLAPGGRPSVQMLMAGLNASGDPNLRAGVSRQIAA